MSSGVAFAVSVVVGLSHAAASGSSSGAAMVS